MLYDFYGETCPHCVEMMPIVDKLIEEGIEIEKLEVWKDEKNNEKFKELNKDRCPGVPFFLNTDTDQWICGATDEETLRNWAKGEDIDH